MSQTRRSALDSFYRSLLLTKFFTNGWGKPEHMERVFALRRQLGDRATANSYVAADHAVVIDRETKGSSCRLLEGHFVSPAKDHLGPDLLPRECETAHFQMVLPLKDDNKG
jgi:hypothetical protein